MDPPAQPAWTAHLLHLDHPHPAPLSGTDDLISRFHLAPVYDTFLRPYLPQPAPSAPALLLPDAGPAVAPEPASPAQPIPASTTGGLKITLGGIHFGSGGVGGGSNTSAAGDSADGSRLLPLAPGSSADSKKRKRARMEKTYEHLVGDVLGRISQPRSAHPATTTTTASLLHLVSNPDPTPCPPLLPLDPHHLRDALTLRAGPLAGFDMGVWAARTGTGAPGSAASGHKKKKKRKHDDTSGPGAAHASDPKKPRR